MLFNFSFFFLYLDVNAGNGGLNEVVSEKSPLEPTQGVCILLSQLIYPIDGLLIASMATNVLQEI